MVTQSNPEADLLAAYIEEMNDLAEELGTLRSVLQHINLTAKRTDISRRMRITLIINTTERNYGGTKPKAQAIP
jgi:hypothetical protein